MSKWYYLLLLVQLVLKNHASVVGGGMIFCGFQKRLFTFFLGFGLFLYHFYEAC